MSKQTYLISQAHEWAYDHGLCDRLGRLEDADSCEVADLALADPFADRQTYGAKPTADPDGITDLVEGVAFPDGSAVFWTEEMWSVTDPDLLDLTEAVQLLER